MPEFLEVLVNLPPFCSLNSSDPTNCNTTPNTATANNNKDASPLKVAVRNKHLHFAQLLVWVRYYF